MSEEVNHDIEDIPKSPLKVTVPAAFLAVIIASTMFIVLTKDPGSGGPLIILSFLLLIFLALLTSTVIAIRIIERKSAQKFSWLRILYTGVAIAAGGVFLIGLKTLRQLQAIDIALVVVFELLLNFYLLRRF
jgi:hypothetical protein